MGLGALARWGNSQTSPVTVGEPSPPVGPPPQVRPPIELPPAVAAGVAAQKALEQATAPRTRVEDGPGAEYPGGNSSAGDQVIRNQDGSFVRSEFSTSGRDADWDERHTVTTADGRTLIFENSGSKQSIYDERGRLLRETIRNGDKLVTRFSSADADGVDEKAATEAARSLYNALSSQRSAEGTPALVVEFRAKGYEWKDSKAANTIWVGSLTQRDVGNYCGQYGTTQDLTNDAAQTTTPRRAYTPSAYGTEVHKKVETWVKAMHDPNFDSERSLWKTLEEAPNDALKEGPKYRGQRGSIRIDVYDRNGDTACVYDIKTGGRGLSYRRMDEIMRGVRQKYPDVLRIIVTEVRPQMNPSTTGEAE